MEVLLGREDFESWERDAAQLMQKHFEEVDGNVEPRRKFKLDSQALAKAAALGYVRIYTVRRDSELLGYCTWGIEYDPESCGLLIAKQGAWYMAPGVPYGLKLFKHCLADLKRAGVKCVYPHHRLQGRGTDRLGAWFKRLGARPIQLDYSLWIGD